MNKFFFPLILLFFFNKMSYSQEKKDLKISISTGFFNTQYYTNAKARQFYNLGFDYSITNRHSICADFNSGQFRYYDSIRVTSPIPISTPGFEKHTNADARTTFFSVLYKYKLLAKRKFAIRLGAGIGIITESFSYPIDLANGGFTFETSGGKGDLAIPLRVDVDYEISKKVQLGLISGTYIYPDYPFAGQHIGIKVSYIIK
ncbi:MAG: hypothetical protein KA319_07090 [Ferruginibacter sp.]|nr:hypothetical protein [Ferruginibacter sp.]